MNLSPFFKSSFPPELPDKLQFVKSISLDPIEKSAIVEYFKNPFRILMEQCIENENPYYNEKEAPFGTSIKLVAGARFELTTFGL